MIAAAGLSPRPLCSNCLGRCNWTEDAWVCLRCGDEWYPDHHPMFASPDQVVHAWLWHGRTSQEVVALGETPKRYRIQALTTTRLAGPRQLLKGEIGLVPKYALTFTPPKGEQI